jgi:hypothetical protein
MGFPLAAALPLVGAGVSAAGQLFGGGGKEDPFINDLVFDPSWMTDLPDIQGAGDFFDISQDPGMLAELDAIRKNAALLYNQYEPGALEGATARGFRVKSGDVRNKLAQMAGRTAARQGQGAIRSATAFRRRQFADRMRAARLLQMAIFGAKSGQARQRNAALAQQRANALSGLMDLIPGLDAILSGGGGGGGGLGADSGLGDLSFEEAGDLYAGNFR